MKRIIYSVLICTLCFSINCFSEMPVTVKINDKLIEFDVEPQIINGRTMVPMRKIYEELGAEVEWIDEAQLILATYENKIIALKIGSDKLNITDVISGVTSEITLDVPPQIINSRTLVPIRAVAEALEKNVIWDGDTYSVLITDTKEG